MRPCAAATPSVWRVLPWAAANPATPPPLMSVLASSESTAQGPDAPAASATLTAAAAAARPVAAVQCSSARRRAPSSASSATCRRGGPSKRSRAHRGALPLPPWAPLRLSPAQHLPTGASRNATRQGPSKALWISSETSCCWLLKRWVSCSDADAHDARAWFRMLGKSSASFKGHAFRI